MEATSAIGEQVMATKLHLSPPWKCCVGLGKGVSPGPDLGGATHYLGEGGMGAPVDKSQLLNAGRKSLA